MAWYTEILQEYVHDGELARVLSKHKSRAGMVKSWAKFDWLGLGDALVEALEPPLRRYLAAHEVGAFSRMVIDADASSGSVCLSLDSSDERARRPGDYDHRDIAPNLAAYQAWQLRYVETIELVCAVETLDEICDELDDDDLPDADEFRETFLRTCADAAFRLEQVARANASSARIEALAWDHDEPVATARRRMATLRKSKGG